MNSNRIILICLLSLSVWLASGCSIEELGESLNADTIETNHLANSVSQKNELSDKLENDKSLVQVTRVVDGDTIIVKLNGQEERVRLIGIDTPETVHPQRGEEPFGREASDYTKSRLDGEEIHLEFDVQERDQYGRILAYVWIGEEHFNATLVEQGYATVSTWPPNVKYVEIYTELQTGARENNRGLWGVASIANDYVVGSYEIDPDSKRPLQKININSATSEELQLIPGIGEVLAQRIIQSRPFANINELTRVNGIGQKTLDNMREYVVVK